VGSVSTPRTARALSGIAIENVEMKKRLAELEKNNRHLMELGARRARGLTIYGKPSIFFP